MSTENKDSLTLGAFIKKKRKDKGFTLREVEEKTGISNTYISNLENGVKDSPSMETLFKLSKALEIDFNQLLVVAGLMNEQDLITSPEETQYFESATLIKNLESLKSLKKELSHTKSIEEKEALLQQEKRLENRIKKFWAKYDLSFKELSDDLKLEVDAIETNKDLFEKDLSIPIWVDAQNNVNIQVYRGNEILNKQDTETLNAMIKGFLFDKNFINYNEE